MMLENQAMKKKMQKEKEPNWLARAKDEREKIRKALKDAITSKDYLEKQIKELKAFETNFTYLIEDVGEVIGG